MKHISLFNGIGGFQLAAAWMDWENIASCEIDEWCNQITKYYWPNCKQHGNIKTTDFTIYRGECDILTGGFPCQPYSIAGQRKGKDDERWMLEEIIRATREICPHVLVLENVAGLISILEPASLADLESEALQFYNQEHLLFTVEPAKRHKIELTLEVIQERVIAEVIEKIEAEGYLLPRTAKGEPIVYCIPACAVNAPHRRDRVWFVAYRNCSGLQTQGAEQPAAGIAGVCTQGATADTDSINGRREKRELAGEQEQRRHLQKIQAVISIGATTDTTGKRGERAEFGEQRKAGKQKQGQPGGGNCKDVATDTSSIGCNDGCNNRQERHIQADERVTPESESERDGWKCRAREAGTVITDTNGIGQRRENNGVGESGQFNKEGAPNDWQDFPTQSPVCGGDDGVSRKLDGITFSKWRNNSIKAYGNAIVPQVALQIFKAIEQYEQSM